MKLNGQALGRAKMRQIYSYKKAIKKCRKIYIEIADLFYIFLMFELKKEISKKKKKYRKICFRDNKGNLIKVG